MPRSASPSWGTTWRLSISRWRSSWPRERSWRPTSHVASRSWKWPSARLLSELHSALGPHRQ
eukprot:5982925-Pyramimonas_sp.AAC.1